MAEELSTAAGAQVSTNVEEGFSDGDVLVRNFPRDGAPLLSSCYFQYTNEDHELSSKVDHHVEQLIVLPGFPDPGKVELGMHDDGRDADYYFKVVHHLVQDNRVRSFTRGLDIGPGRDVEVPIERPDGDFLFVLGGLQLAFRGDDHHIDEVGISESGGAVKVRFNDKNDDDSFVFRLKYSHVPRDCFAAVGTARGENASDAEGDASESCNGASWRWRSCADRWTRFGT